MARVIECARCGNETIATGPRTIYCPKCSYEVRIEKQNQRRSGGRKDFGTKHITCEACGKDVEVPIKAARARFCPECASKSFRNSHKEFRKKEKERELCINETIEGTCKKCGATFSYFYRGGSKRMFCNLCSDSRRIEFAGENEPNYRAGWHCISEPKKKKKPRVSQIDSIQRAAHEAGMSYGKYQALLAVQKMQKAKQKKNSRKKGA